MSPLVWTNAMVPVSFYPWKIAPQVSPHRVVFYRSGTTSSGQTWTRVKSDSVVVHSSADPRPRSPSDPSGPWKTWLLGVIMSTVLSFFSSKWGPLLKVKNEAEEVVEKAERVTEIVEKVADEVDEVAEEIETDLPEGGKLREAALTVEKVAKTTAEDAEIVEDVIHKVEAVEKDVDSFMESADEPKPTSTSAR